MTKDIFGSKATLWFAFGIFCIIWFAMTGTRTLVPTDEGRYAEMAREMAATGDWITPRLNGIKYFEKPPLQTWATALTFKVFGLGEWQARLWTGLCGFLGVLMTALAGKRLYGARTGVAAGMVLASSFMWSLAGHFNTLDMGLAGMMCISLCALLIAQHGETDASGRRRWMLACWAGMALAVLSKGLIGVVLPGAVLVLYTLLTRDWHIWKRLHPGSGLLVFFAIAAPWFILVSIRNPEFAHFFFIHEHFERFTTKVHHRVGPWYYFIPVLLLGILPWLGAFFSGMKTHGRREANGFRPHVLLLIWTCFIFVFFSASGSKLVSYILPIFPALALLIGKELPLLSKRAWLAMAAVAGIAAAVGLGVALRLPSLAPDAVDMPRYEAAQLPLAAGMAILLLGALLAAWWSRAKTEHAWFNAAFALAAGSFLGGQLLMEATEAQGRYRAGLHLLPAITAELTPETPLYAVGLYDQTLPFYLRRTMTLVEHADELEFGLEQEPQLWLPNREDFIRLWNTGLKSIAITRPAIAAELSERGVRFRTLAQDDERVVITNDLKQP